MTITTTDIVDSTTVERPSIAVGGNPQPLRRPVSLLGGAALLIAPLLITGGTVTSPPQASNSASDYIESLARDPFLSSVSATLFHYGWVAIAFGAVAALGLLRGPRGRVLTLIGGIATAFAAIQISGMLLSDWFLISLGQHVSLEQAALVFTEMPDLSVTVWLQSGKLAVVVPVLLYAGLARAGVISWWLVPLAPLPMVVPFVLGGLVGGGTLGAVVGAASGLACFAPTFLTGARLIARGRLATQA